MIEDEENIIEIYATNEKSLAIIESILDDYEYEGLPYLKKQKTKENDSVQSSWIYEDHFEGGIRCVISLRKERKLI